MPYIITERWDGATHPKPGNNPVAVATLGEARAEARTFINTVADRSPGRWMYEMRQECQQMPESGGVIGPLPDGTVIEVRPITLYGLAENAGWRGWRLTRVTARPDLVDPSEIIDAYNAQS
jgi:hypothetical protein